MGAAYDEEKPHTKRRDIDSVAVLPFFFMLTAHSTSDTLHPTSYSRVVFPRLLKGFVKLHFYDTQI